MEQERFDETPPSREVRLQDEVLVGEAERLAFKIYSGGTGELVKNIVELELVIESRQAKSVEGLAYLLRMKLLNDGYIVIQDIDDATSRIHSDNVLGIPHQKLD